MAPSPAVSTTATLSDAVVDGIGTAHICMLGRYQTRPRPGRTVLDNPIVPADAASVRSRSVGWHLELHCLVGHEVGVPHVQHGVIGRHGRDTRQSVVRHVAIAQVGRSLLEVDPGVAPGDAAPPDAAVLVTVPVPDDVGGSDCGLAGRAADVDAGGGAVMDVGVGNGGLTPVNRNESTSAERGDIARVHVGRGGNVGRGRLDGELAGLVEGGLDLHGGVAVPDIITGGIVNDGDVPEAEDALPDADEGLVGLPRLEDQDGPPLGVLGVAPVVVQVGILGEVGR